MNIDYEIIPLDARFRAKTKFGCTHKVIFQDTRARGSVECRLRRCMIINNIESWLGYSFYCYSSFKASNWWIRHAEDKKWSYAKTQGNQHENLEIFIKDKEEFEDIMVIAKLTGLTNC